MSVNVKTKDGLKQIADKTTKNKIKNVLGYTPADENELNSHKGDVIKHISSEERERWNKKPETYSELKEKPNIETENDDNTFSVVDNYGNVILRVDSKGLSTTEVYIQDLNQNQSIKNVFMKQSSALSNLEIDALLKY